MRLLLWLPAVLLTSCVLGPSGPVPPSSPGPAPQPAPAPVKPAECHMCNNVGMNIAMCDASFASCMGSCAPADVQGTAMCQSSCNAQHGACLGTAAVPNCPTYCN
jgi:hypothetical protein